MTAEDPEKVEAALAHLDELRLELARLTNDWTLAVVRSYDPGEHGEEDYEDEAMLFEEHGYEQSVVRSAEGLTVTYRNGPAGDFAPDPSDGPALPAEPLAAGTSGASVFPSTGRRLVAWVIDNVLILVASYILLAATAEVLYLVGALRAAQLQDYADLGLPPMLAAASGLLFVIGWTSRRRATPGMRLLRLQVGDAVDARALTLRQAVIRWATLGYPFLAFYASVRSLIGINEAVRSLIGIVALAELGLVVAVLTTTIADPTKQGLHDRLARSAVVYWPPSTDVPAPEPRKRSLIQNLLIIVGAVALMALTYLGSTLRTDVASSANLPPAGQVWFGSTVDPTTFEVDGKTSTATQGQQVVLVAHLSSTVPKGSPVHVVMTQPDGQSVTGTPQAFDHDGDFISAVIPVPPGFATGDYSFEVEDAGGNRLASGSLQVVAAPAPVVLTDTPATAAATDPFPGGFPHQLPDLEAILPTVVAGRTMAKWSVRGADFFGLHGPLTADELKGIEADLASEGLVLDDVGLAIAGRSDVDVDPPYFVNAYRFAGFPADGLPRELGIDNPDPGAWTEATVGGKPVLVGTEAMLDQTGHLLGRPYLYNSGDIRFVVATNDEAWAADALGQLP